MGGAPHHEELEKIKNTGSLRRSLGMSRYAEYDADGAAFFQASDPQRQSNPLGAISFLERLRDEEKGGINWEPVHGRLTDRILNLKSLLHLLDLPQFSVGSTSFTPMDPALQKTLAKLKKGGRLGRLLQAPPDLPHEWDAWEKDVTGLLKKADWKLLNLAIPEIYERLEELLPKQKSTAQGMSSSQVKFSGYMTILKMAIDQWDTLFNKKYASLAAREKTVWRIFLLESTVRLPLFSKPNDPVLKTAGISQSAKPFKQFLQDNKVFDELQNCCGQIDSPIYRDSAASFAARLAYETLGPNGAFDNSQGNVEIKNYLEKSARFARWVASIEKPTLLANAADAGSPSDLWTIFIFMGAFVLADLGQLKEEYQAEVQKIADENHFSPVPVMNERIFKIIAPYREQASSAAQAVTEFSIKHWGFQEIETTFKRLREVYDELLKEVPREQSDLFTDEEKQGLEDILRPDLLETKRGRRPGKLDYNNPKHKALLMEAATLFRKLPDEMTLSQARTVIPDMLVEMSSSQFVSKKYFIRQFSDPFFVHVDFESYQAGLTAVRWFQTVSVDEASYNDSIEYTDDAFGGTDTKLFSSLENLNELIQIIQDIKGAEQVFGIPAHFSSTKIKMEKMYTWADTAFWLLERELSKALERESPEDFFRILDHYLQHWQPVINPEIVSIFTAKEDLLKAGLGFLNLSQQPLDRQTLMRLMSLTFLMEDVSVSRTLQEYILLALIEQVDFAEASNLIFDRYAAQGMVGGLRPFEKLAEEKAQTPEDFKALKQRAEQWLHGDGVSDPQSQLSDLLIAEAIFEFVMKDADQKRRFLFSLLASSQDEKQLRELLVKIWWAIYRDYMMTDLQPVEEVKTRAELDEIAKRRPPILDASRTSDIYYQSAENMRGFLYRMGPMERYGLLRQLLTGQNGMLAGQKGRQDLLEEFFRIYLRRDVNSPAAGLLKEVLSALFRAAPVDELYMVLECLLRYRIANPPEKMGTFEAEAGKLAAEAVSKLAIPEDLWNEKPIGDDPENPRFVKYAEALMESAVQSQMIYSLRSAPLGAIAEQSEAEKAFSIVPENFTQRQSRDFDPIELILEIAKQLGAPGVRFLQLLGQTIEVPPEYSEKFLTVYDSMKGQSKLAAWETIKREQPDYAAKIKRLIKRLGGGSLFTVYEAELLDGTHEVVRVLNPNVLYHTKVHLKVLRDALTELAAKDPKYRKALPLLDLIEDWIQNELEDPTFEADDEKFRGTWDGWQPSGFKAKIKVPKIIATGSVKVRREEFIEGENLTELKTFPPEKQKELVALAVQHYAGQIRGSLWKDTTLVHSDISAGNLRATRDGNLAILDRGMYLKFSRNERLFIRDLTQEQPMKDRVTLFVDWLWKLPVNQEAAAKLDKNKIIDEIVQNAITRQIDPEEIALNALVVVQEQGIKIPLKFALLFKNLNAFRQLVQSVGKATNDPSFNSLAAALKYKPNGRAELRSITQTFADEILQGNVPETKLMAAAGQVGKIVSVQEVIDDMKALRREVAEDAQKAQLPMDPKIIQAEIDAIISALGDIKDQGYTVGYWVPESPDPAAETDFASAAGQFPTAKQILVQGKVTDHLRKELEKKGKVPRPFNVSSARNLTLPGDGQNYAGLVVSNRSGQSIINEKLIPVAGISTEETDPLIAKYVVTLQTAIAVLLAHQIKDETRKKTMLLHPAELLKNYHLVAGFEDRIVTGTATGLEISTVAVRAYLEWKASQQVQSAA